MRRDYLRRLTVGAALAMLTFLPGSVTSAPPDTPPASAAADAEALRIVDEAAEAIAAGRHEEAIAALDAAINGHKLTGMPLAVAYHHRGMAHQKTGDGTAAIADYTKAIDLGTLPEEMKVRVHYNRALAEAATGNKMAAELDYSRAIELAPSYAPAWHNRANLERERRDYPTAIRDYGEAMARLDGDKRKFPLLGRALAYERSGNLPAAVADLREALAIDPQFQPARAKLDEFEPMLAEAEAGAEGQENLATGSIGSGEMAPASRQVPVSRQVIEVAPKNGWTTQARRYGAEPVTETETEKPRRLTSLPPAEPVARQAAASGKGSYRIQLGAFRAQGDASKAWNDMLARHPILAPLDHRIEEADLGEKGVFFRLQAGSFKTRAEARAYCERLKAKRLDCLVAGG